MADLTKYFKSQINYPSKSKQINKPNEIDNASNKYFNLYTKDLLVTIDNVKNILRSNKEKYLAVSNFRTSGFSEDEKEKFDSEIIKSLKTIEINLSELKKLLETKNSVLKPINKTDLACKTTAISCIYKRGTDLSEYFKKMQMSRLSQKKKINKIFGVPNDINKKKTVPNKAIPSINAETQPQNIELIKESHQLIEKFDNDVEEVQQAQAKMIELSSLINTFSQKVIEQDTTTEQILELASQSFNLLTEGNKHLGSATKYNEQYGIIWAIIYSTLALILIVMDYIN